MTCSFAATFFSSSSSCFLLNAPTKRGRVAPMWDCLALLGSAFSGRAPGALGQPLERHVATDDRGGFDVNDGPKTHSCCCSLPVEITAVGWEVHVVHPKQFLVQIAGGIAYWRQHATPAVHAVSCAKKRKEKRRRRRRRRRRRKRRRRGGGGGGGRRRRRRRQRDRSDRVRQIQEPMNLKFLCCPATKKNLGVR